MLQFPISKSPQHRNLATDSFRAGRWLRCAVPLRIDSNFVSPAPRMVRTSIPVPSRS
jgi:hypothetical protein